MDSWLILPALRGHLRRPTENALKPLACGERPSTKLKDSSTVRHRREPPDTSSFNAPECSRRRAATRRAFGFSDTEFVCLLIGNDWRGKGLTCLLQAVAFNRELPFRVLIAGRDDRAPFLTQAKELRIESPVVFAEPSPDVTKFMAAADAYAGPSLHDSFALPLWKPWPAGFQ